MTEWDHRHACSVLLRLVSESPGLTLAEYRDRCDEWDHRAAKHAAYVLSRQGRLDIIPDKAPRAPRRYVLGVAEEEAWLRLP